MLIKIKSNEFERDFYFLKVHLGDSNRQPQSSVFVLLLLLSKEGWKEGRKKEGRKEGRNLSLFFDILYLKLLIF